MSHFCNQVNPEPSIFENTLPTLISATIVVLIFIIGLFIDSKIRKKNIKRDWYFKVIIEPNISKVEKFIEDIFISVKSSITVLIESQSTVSHEEYLTIKSTEFGKIQKVKRNFELDFILFLKANNPEIKKELTDFILLLEDTTTNILDQEELTLEALDRIEEDIRNFKIKLFLLLYKPL